MLGFKLIDVSKRAPDHVKPLEINHLSAGAGYIRDSNLFITVPADTSTPDCAKPSADTVIN